MRAFVASVSSGLRVVVVVGVDVVDGGEDAGGVFADGVLGFAAMVHLKEQGR